VACYMNGLRALRGGAGIDGVGGGNRDLIPTTKPGTAPGKDPRAPPTGSRRIVADLDAGTARDPTLAPEQTSRSGRLSRVSAAGPLNVAAGDCNDDHRHEYLPPFRL
jgi:hypothetical protein